MENKNIKEYKFYVSGTHCKSCSLIIEEEVGKMEGIDFAHVDFYKNELEIKSSLNKDKKELSEILTGVVAHHGYKISVERSGKNIGWSEFIYAIPISIAVVVAFYMLQKMGFVNFINGNGELGYGTIFMIGVVASLSSCLAVVGGLVLSVSANYGKEGGGATPQVIFHVGRIIGFFILGGIVGILGNSFYLTTEITFMIGMLLSAVMFILGLNLLGIFDSVKKFQILMPKFFGEKIIKNSGNKNFLAPIFMGVGTFFLPCGFTQSMQMYALSTHDFWRGGFVMFVFSLGTLPVLSLLSFGAFSVNNKTWSGVFYKTSGLLIMFLSLFNLFGALSAYGIIPPVFNI